MKSPSLPFSLTRKSLAIWQEKLHYMPINNAAIHMHEVLHLLSKTVDESWQLFPLLVDLSPQVLMLTHSLTALNYDESEQIKKTKSFKFAKLGLELLKLLSSMFCKVAESRQLELTETQLAGYYALQLIGQSLQNYCLLYQIPSSIIWKKTAILYKIAIETNGLETIQPSNIPEFQAQPTILAVIKRNLLFSMFEPTRYNQAEINEFFKLSNSHFNLLEINPHYTSHCSFYWDQENQPHPISASKHSAAKDVIKIDCQQFVLNLQNDSIETSLNPLTKTKIIQKLTGYKQVLATINTGLCRASNLIIGFSLICQYLKALDKFAKIHKLSDQLNAIHSPITKYFLLPIGHENNLLKDTSEHPFLPIHTADLVQKDHNIVVITEKNKFEAHIGQLVLLDLNRDKTLAIIRQKTLNDSKNKELILMDLIAGQTSIYSFNGATGSIYQLIMINENSDNPEAILPRGKYQINSKITLSLGRIILLKACLEYNPYLCRFSVGFK